MSWQTDQLRSQVTVRSLVLIAAMMLFLGGCAAVPALNFGAANLPPVMALEDLNRPYSKIGRINVTRKVYGADYDIAPNLHAWGIEALRIEAGKLDADAVILPEITSREMVTVIFPSFPATEYRATGVAIKFGR